jgi:uncharacterized protein (TIGR00304 family)
VVILYRHDKDVLALLIFCILCSIVSCLLKTLFLLNLVRWRRKPVDATVFYLLGATLIAAGIIIIVVTIILASIRGAEKGAVKGAGVIMIGPVPIIFGTDKKSVKTVLMLALALTIAMIIVMVVFYWLLR